MADDKGGEAAPIETNALQPVEVERDYEKEAVSRGWTPKEDWKGDPHNWKDAKSYVERSDDIVRITKNQMAAQEKDFAERLKKLQTVTDKTVEQLQKAHEKELADLKAQRREAIKAGDVDKAEKLDDQIDDLKDDKPDKKLTGAALDKHNQKVQEEWVGKQDWWDTDEEMTDWAIGRSQRIAAKTPDISIEDNLAQLEKELAKKFPDKFGGARLVKTEANGHAPVDGGGDFPGGKGTDPLAKLPAEARAQAKADMAKYPKIYKTAADWLETYEGKR